MRQRLIWLVMAVAAVVPAFGGPVVNLGTASSFGLLGGTIIGTITRQQWFYRGASELLNVREGVANTLS